MSGNSTVNSQVWECGHHPIINGVDAKAYPNNVCPTCYVERLQQRLNAIKLVMNTCQTTFQAFETAEARLKVLQQYRSESNSNNKTDPYNTDGSEFAEISPVFASIVGGISALEANPGADAIDAYAAAMGRFRAEFQGKIRVVVEKLRADARVLALTGGFAAEKKCALIILQETGEMMASMAAAAPGAKSMA